MDSAFEAFGGTLGSVISSLIFLVLGFFALKALLLFLKNWWLDEVQAEFVSKIKWVLLEIRFPKENETFPKAMEQVFSSFYQIYSFGIKPEKKWFAGQIEEKISAEMVSSRDGIKFFLRVNEKFRVLVESAIFSRYPNAEIIEADHDYVNDLSSGLPDNQFDIMGADMVFGKDSPYPIRTYPYFFGERKFEEQEVDPIASLAEVMSNLKSDERLWVQVLISPAGDSLRKEADKLIGTISGKKEAPQKGGLTAGIAEFTREAVLAPVKYPEWGVQKAEDKPKSLSHLESDVIKAVDAKASKTAFHTIIRVIYIDNKNDFTKSNFIAATGAFQQFNTQNLNYLRPAKLTVTVAPRFIRKEQRLLRRKKEIYKNYINRSFTVFTNVQEIYRRHIKPSLMNVEELATIYHPPISKVSATGLRQVESKKSAPPANLPIG